MGGNASGTEIATTLVGGFIVLHLVAGAVVMLFCLSPPGGPSPPENALTNRPQRPTAAFEDCRESSEGPISDGNPSTHLSTDASDPGVAMRRRLARLEIEA